MPKIKDATTPMSSNGMKAGYAVTDEVGRRDISYGLRDQCRSGSLSRTVSPATPTTSHVM
jgi:hypothetical protein